MASRKTAVQMTLSPLVRDRRLAKGVFSIVVVLLIYRLLTVLQISYCLFKLFASILVILEQVEAGAGRAQQYGIPFGGKVESGLNGFFRACGIDHERHIVLKSFVDLPVVQSQADDSLDLF